MLWIASFFRVEHGKISTYNTRFDATVLRKLPARTVQRAASPTSEASMALTLER
jgi:hypothetical protein